MTCCGRTEPAGASDTGDGSLTAGGRRCRCLPLPCARGHAHLGHDRRRSISIAAGYFGNELTSRRQRDQAREQSDRDWLEKAATLCRSKDPKEREHGLGFLRALIKLPEIDPRVQDLLEEMTRQELGHTLAAARKAVEETGELPDIVEVAPRVVGTETEYQPEELTERGQEDDRGNA